MAKLTGNSINSFLEGPICNGTQVIGWHLNESSRKLRRFHADMSGFAFNSTIIWDPKQWHRPTPEPIRQLDRVKDGFLVSISCFSLIVSQSIQCTTVQRNAVAIVSPKHKNCQLSGLLFCNIMDMKIMVSSKK